MTRRFTVLATGPLTTVQDEGRPGLGAQGVGRGGACDRSSYRLANRLVGNEDGAAVLEVTFGGLRLVAEGDLVVATTGARCPSQVPHLAPTRVRAGQEVRWGTPASGLRTYLAVRGGLLVEPVLGSRSTNVLSGLGPLPLTAGTVVAVGVASRPPPGVDLAALREPVPGPVTVRVSAGPRRDWVTDRAWAELVDQAFTVSSESNRVGLRLAGTPVARLGGELASEGLVRGAMQLPPSGLPVLMLADHPVTGGYPVVAYVDDVDVDRCAQLRPGQALRLRLDATPEAARLR